VASIRIQALSHSYQPGAAFPQDFVLKDLDLNWLDGGAYALLGPSGCGKSTLLNILSGLIRPTRGQIFFDGQDVTDWSARQRHIAKVFQFPVIYETLSVFDNLAFPLRNRGVSEAEVKTRVAEVAALLGLTPLLAKKAARLATERKQLVSLGRGLVRKDVSAILFDEPLTVIDPQQKWRLRTKLRELHSEIKRTTIYVTHDQTEALTFADTVMVMNDGKILQSGSPQDLFERPTHKFVGQFIGSPGMNFMPCKIDDSTALLGEHTLPLGKSYTPDRDSPLELGFRPEYVRFSTDGSGIPAELLRVESTGRRNIAHLTAAGTSLCASLPIDAEIPTDNHRISIDVARAFLYSSGELMESHA
jgi:glycerol transport system ATP-binding protein